MDVTKLGKGAMHKADAKRYVFASERLEPYDWTKPYDRSIYESKILKIRDQGQSKSCVAQTEAETLDIISDENDHSEHFIYSQIFIEDTGGAYVADGLKIGSQEEVPSNSVFPSEPETEEHMRDKTGIDIVKLTNINPFVSIPLDMESIAIAIREHKAVHLAVQGDNQGWQSAYVIPPKIVEWGHDITLVEPVMTVLNGNKYFRFLNHWGSGWGEGGYGYIGEDYFTSGNVIVSMGYSNNYYVPSLKTMIGFKKTNDPKVYVQVGEQYLWVKDMQTYLSLGGNTASIVELQDDAFSKLPIDQSYCIGES
ncbi:MAG: hypothetical protein KGN01_06555 [Patescibacteria group bacterium]|nr:hypothetical protein [Patescibacteria group bacterium]